MELNTVIFLIFGAVISFFIISKLLGLFSSKNGETKFSSKKSRKNLPKEHVLICGPSGAGKTCLINSLALGQYWETVTSIEENAAKFTLLNEEEKKTEYWDVPGHYHYRERTIDSAERAKLIILVVDSKDKDKFSEAGSFLFDFLNNHTIAESDTQIIIACNKQDLQFAKKSTVLELELEKQIDEIKRVKVSEREEESEDIGVLEL